MTDPPAAKPNRHFSVPILANTVDLSFLPKTLFLDLETPHPHGSSPGLVLPSLPETEAQEEGALGLLSPYTHFVGDLRKSQRVQCHLHADDSLI